MFFFCGTSSNENKKLEKSKTMGKKRRVALLFPHCFCGNNQKKKEKKVDVYKFFLFFFIYIKKRNERKKSD